MSDVINRGKPAPRVAIVMLACSDFEAMEVALACHGAFLPKDVPFYILQNCRGTYDSERTFEAAKRMERLFPGRITVIDEIAPGPPYHSICKLLESERFREIDLVCKLDDDAFPLTEGWLDKMLETYNAAEAETAAEDSAELAYVTPLINNNNWGFPVTIRAMGLEEEYFSQIARDHYAGAGSDISPLRILPKDEIDTGTNGTIWGSPHVARWLHERSSLDPDRFIAATADLPNAMVPSEDRYSIGCILFRKELWYKIDNGGTDDEAMFHEYCHRTGARIVCIQSVPFVHNAYFSQREENRDIVGRIRDVYFRWLNLTFPIGLKASRELEIESRLRWIEGQRDFGKMPTGLHDLKPNAIETSGPTEASMEVEVSVFESLCAIGYILLPYNKRRKAKKERLLSGLRRS